VRYLIKRIQVLKSRKGFTLVEVMCAVVIFAVVLAAVFAMFDPISKISAMIKGDSTAQKLTLTISDYIAAQVQTATDVEVYWVDDSVSTANWSSLASKITTFQVKNNNDSLASHDLPHALIVKNIGGTTYFYNVGLKGLSSADITGILAGGAELEKYRVFNRSYYGKESERVDLDTYFEVKVIPGVAPNPDKSTLRVGIDAYREGDLQVKAQRANVIDLVNIGRTNPHHAERLCEAPPAFQQGLTAPVTPLPVAWRGDYLILYNNFSNTL